MRAALAFLTVLGGPARPDGRTLRWFAPVGLALGLALGGAWWAADELWAPLVAAAVVVAADLALTGLLHVDGLADCGDGLVPPLGSVERRLAVMADPTTGAFGVAVVVAVLLLRTTALAATPVDVLLLGALWCTSRSVVAAGAVLLPYARPEGLASDFLGDRAPVLVASSAGVALAVVLGVVADGLQGVVAVAAVVAGAAVVLAFARQRVGGFTGDVLGATIVVGETVGLLAAAAR